MDSRYSQLYQKLGNLFKDIEETGAVGLAGSTTHDAADAISDIDLYVFSDSPVPLDKREEITAVTGNVKKNMGLTFWDYGDSWIDRETGIEVDIMFWDKKWIEQHLKQILIDHHTQLGYSTCHWHTLLNMKILFDRDQWLEKLQLFCKQRYPQALKSAIINKNYPVLRNIIPSYYNQVKKALHRGDLVSVNHRLAALLASYFDVLFSINELPHPGEKRMLVHALQKCAKCPADLEQNIASLFKNRLSAANLLSNLEKLIDALETLLLEEDLLT